LGRAIYFLVVPKLRTVFLIDAGQQTAFRPEHQNLEKTKFGYLDLVLS
jgi:hypothetical protein